MANEPEADKAAETSGKSESGKDETQFPLLKDDFVPDVSAAKPVVNATGTATSEPVDASKPEPQRAHLNPESPDMGSLLSRILIETPPTPIVVPQSRLKAVTRRDLLIYGVGAVAAVSGFYKLLPEDTQGRLIRHVP